MARRSRKPRKQRATNYQAPSPQSFVPGSSGLQPAVGAGIGLAMNLGGSWMQSNLSGTAFHWYDHIPGVRANVSAAQGMSQSLGIASIVTGIPWGFLDPSAQALGRLQDPLNKGSAFNTGTPVFTGGFQALSMNASYLQGGGTLTGLTGLTGAMMTRFGGAESAAFQAATSALAPAFADPFIREKFAQASVFPTPVGLGGVAGAYHALGPSGAFSAIGATSKPQQDMATLQEFDRRARSITLERFNNQAYTDVGDINIASQALTGNRSRLSRAYGLQMSALEERNTNLVNDIDFYARAAAAGDPYSRSRVYELDRERAGVQLRRNQVGFERATMGAGAGWINRTSDLETSAAIQSSDPFHLGLVSNSTRRGLIGEYSQRLGEIDAQTAGNPAARAALAGERSSLMTGRAEQRNALRMGILGQIFDVSMGAPSGFQSWGLGGSTSAAAQRHDPGIAQGMGGTGESVGSGDTDTKQLLRQINSSLQEVAKNTRTQGSSGGPQKGNVTTFMGTPFVIGKK
jgi:hypothetical protein